MTVVNQISFYKILYVFCKFRPQDKGAPKTILSSLTPLYKTNQNILIFFKGRTAMMDFYVKIHSEIGRFTAKKFPVKRPISA